MGWIAGLVCCWWLDGPVDAALASIRAEASLPSTGTAGRPLPLVSHWNTGGPQGQGFTPDWQVEQLRAGRHLLPWFPLAEPGQRGKDFTDALQQCRRANLPITLVSTQWERLLSTDRRFQSLPADVNPNVIRADGQREARVSPFGSVDPWREVGRIWGESEQLRQIQEAYPQPPLVILLSNNEHAKLEWPKLQEDSRGNAVMSTLKTDEDRRRWAGDAWIERHRALHDGLRSALTPAWQRVVKFVGYDAFGPEFLGRWPGWPTHSLYRPGRSSPWPWAWDGAAPSYYAHHWEQSTDYTVFSPQVQAMNWPMMLAETYQHHPAFWFEMSVWDGHQPGHANDKYRYYADRGQTYSPLRHAGFVRFGMWLLRPRVIREFRGHTESRNENEPYLQAILQLVDDLHRHPELHEYWRQGRLVPNRDRKHPYDISVPAEYASADRWFRLTTSLDPPGKWKLPTELGVFALAIEVGEKPRRRWLIVGHSPLRDHDDVTIKIPDGPSVKVRLPIEGAYHRVDESTAQVTPFGRH